MLIKSNKLKYPTKAITAVKPSYKSYNLRSSSNDDDEDDDEDSPGKGFCGYFERQQTLSLVKVNLDETIREPKYYRQVLTRIDSLDEGDELEIHINTYGGNLDGAMALIHSIKSTPANVTGFLEGVAVSAGSIIALSCPNIQVAPHATMMIHSAFGGSIGILNNLANHAQFIDKQVRNIMQDVYADFISEDELEQVYLGRELWFDSDEICTRLEHKFRVQQEREDELERKEQEALATTEDKLASSPFQGERSAKKSKTSKS